jgi:hypothetical protein
LLCADCVGELCARESQAPAPARESVAPYVVTVSAGRRVAIPEEGLAIELVGVKDNRCAAEVKCVWAGYAEITLQVSKSGAAAAPVVIGNPTASKESTSAGASYGPYRFELLGLEPNNSIAKPVELSLYRARIQVTRPSH